MADTVPTVRPAAWRSYCFDPPQLRFRPGTRILLRNQVHQGLEVWTVRLGEIPPWANVADLEWRIDEITE